MVSSAARFARSTHRSAQIHGSSPPVQIQPRSTRSTRFWTIVAVAIDLVKAGSNLRLKKKLLAMDYEAEMRSWTTDAANSDDEEEAKEEAKEEQMEP